MPWPSRAGSPIIQGGAEGGPGDLEAGRFGWACPGGQNSPGAPWASANKVSGGDRGTALLLPPSQASGASSCHVPPSPHWGSCTLTYHMAHSLTFSPFIGYSLEQPHCGGPGYLLPFPGRYGWAWAPEDTEWSRQEVRLPTAPPFWLL